MEVVVEYENHQVHPWRSAGSCNHSKSCTRDVPNEKVRIKIKSNTVSLRSLQLAQSHDNVKCWLRLKTENKTNVFRSRTKLEQDPSGLKTKILRSISVQKPRHNEVNQFPSKSLQILSKNDLNRHPDNTQSFGIRLRTGKAPSLAPYTTQPSWTLKYLAINNINLFYHNLKANNLSTSP